MLSHEQKQLVVKLHNEASSHCPEHIQPITSFDDLLPHQKEHYIENPPTTSNS
jgi:hypothetical protein